MRDVVFGSITKQPRAGNAGNNFYYDHKTGNSINSWGIPNKGIEAYLPELPAIKKQVNNHGARLWVSISAGDAFSAFEYEEMAGALERADAADVIEGNFSCSNMVVDGKPKPNVCYDVETFAAGVQGLGCHARLKKAAAKIAPITEPVILRGLVEACVRYDIDYLVVANTLGHCYLEDEHDKPAITMRRGGLAGKALRPIVKGMIQMIVPMLKGTRTKLIAVGGIEQGKDAYEYLELGAHGFMFNTALTWRNYDPRFAEDLISKDDGDYMTRSSALVHRLMDDGLPD
jgi:dihydroorotate dehydrogenase